MVKGALRAPVLRLAGTPVSLVGKQVPISVSRPSCSELECPKSDDHVELSAQVTHIHMLAENSSFDHDQRFHSKEREQELYQLADAHASSVAASVHLAELERDIALTDKMVGFWQTSRFP